MQALGVAKSIKAGILHRSFEIDRAALKEDARTVELSFASELPVMRWFGEEILDCSPDSVDLSRLNNGGALLVEHNPSDQVGVVESARVDQDKKCRALVRFGTSARAAEIYEDVKNKIRRLVSVGYRVQKMVTEKVVGDVETLRATSWCPMELSIVAVPADPTVGVSRTENTDQTEIPIERKNMGEPNTQTASTSPAVTADPGAEFRKKENERCKEINAIADRVGSDTAKRAARQYIEDGRSLDEFRDHILRNEFKAKPVDVTPEIGLTQKEIKRYSYLRAIQSLASMHRLDGFEKECHDAVAKKLNRNPDGQLAFYIPYEVEATRVLTAGVFASGGALVATDLGSMIEMVRNAMVTTALGARQLGGLVGDVALPKQTGGATAYWLGETTTATATTQAVAQLMLTPHRLAAMTAYSNQFLAQSSIDAESFVRSDLAAVIAIEKDESALNGSGVSGEPLGITSTTGISTCTMGATTTLSYAECVSFETVLAENNLLIPSNLGFAVRPNRRHQMRTTFINTTGGETPIWAGGLTGEVLGYKAVCSNQVTSTYPIIFGNWNDMILADWAGTSVLVDPYSLSTSNQVRIIVQLMCDVGIRNGKSFAIASQ